MPVICIASNSLFLVSSMIWWSFRHGLSGGGVQARWLARDLAAIDRSRTPWVLVTFHNPWRAPRMHMGAAQMGAGAPGWGARDACSCRLSQHISNAGTGRNVSMLSLCVLHV